MNYSAIYGTLLGDTWLFRNKRNFIMFAFSQQNEDYALWKANLLNLPYKAYKVKRFDKRTNKVYTNLTVHLRLPTLQKEKLINLFYNPKKIINEEILNTLTDIGICLWYLDDGCIYYNGNNCHLVMAVNSFSEQEQWLIINYFKDKFDINFKKTKTNIRLVSKKECIKFMNIVENLIPDCMNYKKLSTAIEKYKNKIKK